MDIHHRSWPYNISFIPFNFNFSRERVPSQYLFILHANYTPQTLTYTSYKPLSTFYPFLFPSTSQHLTSPLSVHCQYAGLVPTRPFYTTPQRVSSSLARITTPGITRYHRYTIPSAVVCLITLPLLSPVLLLHR